MILTVKTIQRHHDKQSNDQSFPDMASHERDLNLFRFAFSNHSRSRFRSTFEMLEVETDTKGCRPFLRICVVGA